MLQALLKASPSRFECLVAVEIQVHLDPVYLTVFQMPFVALLGR